MLYLIVLDFSCSFSYQIELSEDEIKRLDEFDDGDYWWDEFRKEASFSNNCAWMISGKPINLCLNQDSKSANVVIRKPHKDNVDNFKTKIVEW